MVSLPQLEVRLWPTLSINPLFEVAGPNHSEPISGANLWSDTATHLSCDLGGTMKLLILSCFFSLLWKEAILDLFQNSYPLKKWEYAYKALSMNTQKAKAAIFLCSVITGLGLTGWFKRKLPRSASWQNSAMCEAHSRALRSPYWCSVSLGNSEVAWTFFLDTFHPEDWSF